MKLVSRASDFKRKSKWKEMNRNGPSLNIFLVSQICLNSFDSYRRPVPKLLSQEKTTKIYIFSTKYIIGTKKLHRYIIYIPYFISIIIRKSSAEVSFESQKSTLSNKHSNRNKRASDYLYVLN